MATSNQKASQARQDRLYGAEGGDQAAGDGATRTGDYSASHVVVTIPGTIDRRLSPNGRAHWRTVHQLKQERKDAAKMATYAARMDANLPRYLEGLSLIEITPPLVLHFVVAWEKGRKRMDDDNIKASLKATIDGIADALGIDDKHITIGTVQQERDTEGRGFIRVAIEQGESA